MPFSDILDQPMPVRLLKNVLVSQRVPNAMLFWGPSGVGKRLAAFELAKAINCPDGDGDACGHCLSCRKISHGNHPDVHLTVPVKKSRIIDVEAIDDILGMAVLRPFEGAWRLFIVLEADRMRAPAQNRLLKTLEEPAGRTLFILVTEQPQALLPTIRSRCQMVRFGSLSPQTVKNLLMRERSVEATVAESVAAVAQGQMTRALELVDSDRRVIVFDFLKRLQAGGDPLVLSEELGRYIESGRDAIEASVKERAEPVESGTLSKDDRDRIKEEQQAAVDAQVRRAIIELLYLMETWYRDKLVLGATGDASRVLNRDQLASLAPAADEDMEAKLGAIAKARLYLERFLKEDRVFRDLFFALAR